MQGANFGNEYPIGADASNVDITVNGTASNVDTVIKNIISGTQTVGNATKVNNHTVNSNVPANAKFTDTVTTVDSSLSTSSTNPVQNKIIKSELDKKLNLSGGTLTGALKITGGTATTTNLDVAGLAYASIGFWAYDKDKKKADGESDVGIRYDYNSKTQEFYLYGNRISGNRGIWDSQLNSNLIGYANGKFVLNAQNVSLGQWLFSNNWYVYKFNDDKRIILFSFNCFSFQVKIFNKFIRTSQCTMSYCRSYRSNRCLVCSNTTIIIIVNDVFYLLITTNIGHIICGV